MSNLDNLSLIHSWIDFNGERNNQGRAPRAWRFVVSYHNSDPEKIIEALLRTDIKNLEVRMLANPSDQEQYPHLKEFITWHSHKIPGADQFFEAAKRLHTSGRQVLSKYAVNKENVSPPLSSWHLMGISDLLATREI